MLSKILREDEADLVRPILWRSLPANAPAPGSRNPRAAPEQTVGVGMRQVVPIEEAKPDASDRIRELERAMEQRASEARTAGFREGEAAAQAQAKAQVQPVLDQLAASIHEVSILRSQLRHQAEEDLLKLSLAIAKKVLHRELQLDPEALAGLIRVALEKIRAQEILRVRSHPQHVAFLQTAMKRLAAGISIDVVNDQRLPVGGIIVETTRGNYDASVDVQLREIERGLADKLAARG